MTPWCRRSRWRAGPFPPRGWSSARWPLPAATWGSCPRPARPASSGPRNAPWTFSPPETAGSERAGEDAAEPVEVNVPAGDDADDPALSRAPGEGTSHRAGPRALGNDPVALGEHAERGRHLVEARPEGAVDPKAPGPLQHLGEDG